MTIAADAFEVQALTDFLYTSSTYTGMTDQEKRKLIKKKLDDYTFALNTSPVSKQIISDILQGSATPSEVQAPAVSEGVVWARAHYDGTTKTAQIKQGKPVCFDMTNGTCVTGVHSSWGPDEYKVVGIALKDYLTLNTIGKIPIRLIPPAAASAEEVALFRTRAKTTPTPVAYPAYVAGQTRRVFPASKILNPSFSGVGSGITSTGLGEEVDIYNTSYLARYILENSDVVAWRVSEKWYFEYVPPTMISATLAEDLLLGSEGLYAGVSSPAPNVLASGEKVKSIGTVRPGYKYASGSRIIAALIGLEYHVIKCFTCPVAQ